MKIYKSEINKEVIRRLQKRKAYDTITVRDGQMVMNAITKVIKKSLLNNILSFGTFWLYPDKKGTFQKRNRTAKAMRLLND